MKILLSTSNPNPQEMDIIRSFLMNEDALFHLRRYDWEEGQVAEFLSQFTNGELEKVVLNHHHFLAAEFGINRLHFSEQDRREIDEDKLQRFADAGFILSTSVHELETFNKLPECFTYAFLSPVFDSISKEGYKAVNFDLSHRRKDVKLIGLGGVTVENFGSLITKGFDGGAVLGAVWNSENPFKVLDSLVKIF